MEWRWCVGHEGYEVSDTGIVRSWLIPGGQGRIGSVPRILKPRTAGSVRRHQSLTVQLGAKNPKYIHRLVFEAFVGLIPSGMEIDHIDRDPRNNCLENLRLVTSSQNKRNSRAKSGRRFKGATYIKRTNRWMAQITVDKKNLFLGYFATEEEAALAYDEAAREHHGEFAVVNFPHVGAA